MNKTKKTFLIIAVSLVLIGSLMFGAVMTVYGWDFKKLSTVEFKTETAEIKEDFNNIEINAHTENILLAASDDGKCSVVGCLPEKETCEAAVKDDALVIKVTDNRSWIERIGISFEKPKITVYLPKDRYDTLSIDISTGDVRIDDDFTFNSIDVSGSTANISCAASADEAIRIGVSTGDVRVEDLSAGELKLKTTTGRISVDSVSVNGNISADVSTGDVDICDVTCGDFDSDGDTGRISLDSVIAKGTLTVTRGTGDVILDGCDASEIYITTDTGDVKGSLLSEKVFFAVTDAGKVNVPRTITGGRCEITTDTGDISIDIDA